jgi:phosphoglycerol transferase MdoB-like AlkP superfamily enzyme
MIYSPGFVAPKEINVMSQIDVIPTVFGLLNFDYQSKFYGQDVLKQTISQELCCYLSRFRVNKDNVLTIISPKKS